MNQYEIVKIQIKTATETVNEIIQISENNKHLLYQGGVASRIPNSFGAHAFISLQHANFRYLIIRLIALWEKSSGNTCIKKIHSSLKPQIVAQAIALARSEYEEQSIASFGEAPDRDWQNSYLTRLADENAKQTEHDIQKAKNLISNTIADVRYESLRDSRNKHFAHVTDPSPQIKRMEPKPLKLGYEDWLIERSMEVVSLLYGAINRVGYDFMETREIYAKNSKCLWDNVDFSRVE